MQATDVGRARVHIAAALLLAAGMAAAQTVPAQQIGQAQPQVQAPAVPVPGSMQPDLVSPVAPDSYIIGVQDLLSVFVYQMPEFTREVRVDAGGDITLPYLHHGIPASGRTAPEVAAALSRELVGEGLAEHPLAQVMVSAVDSKPIIVAGQVHTPATLQAVRPMTLLEVLTRCGGLAPDAGDSVTVTRIEAGRPQPPQTFDLVALVRTHTPADNPLLTGNDWVTVSRAKLVYVVGDLQKPGAFPLRTGESITVLRAVALAQGLGNDPDEKAVTIFRPLPDGKRVEIPVRLDQMLHHGAADVGLHADDVLYVPQNGKKELLRAALQDVGQALVLGVGYGIH